MRTTWTNKVVNLTLSSGTGQHDSFQSNGQDLREHRPDYGGEAVRALFLVCLPSPLNGEEGKEHSTFNIQLPTSKDRRVDALGVEMLNVER